MTEHQNPPVVVAVSDAPNDGALAFAVGEAQQAGCGLHLVHAVPMFPQGAGLLVVDMEDPERLGRQLLDRAVTRARELAPDEVPVTGELLGDGPVVSVLSKAAENAEMMVLQRRPISALRRMVTRSVSGGVAARVREPVVSVPAGWPDAADTTESDAVPTVTAGVDVPAKAAEVLRHGVEEARRRGARLRVMHAWSMTSGYDEMIVDRVATSAWSARAIAEIREALDQLGDAVDGVEIEVEAKHALPAEGLVAASRSSELVVMGRHDPLVPLGSHLGPIARTVLQHADCPVMLVDLHAASAAADSPTMTAHTSKPV